MIIIKQIIARRRIIKSLCKTNKNIFVRINHNSRSLTRFICLFTDEKMIWCVFIFTFFSHSWISLWSNHLRIYGQKVDLHKRLDGHLVINRYEKSPILSQDAQFNLNSIRSFIINLISCSLLNQIIIIHIVRSWTRSNSHSTKILSTLWRGEPEPGSSQHHQAHHWFSY